ncbi:putative pectinesterase [Medicago truncatula]|uniref:Pectinesterase n=1 Tax=Medicago truncatula TaxID=3880 RepID=A0A396J6E9_MEDTR|nr:putative pectinesterase [Medicago truncatula]
MASSSHKLFILLFTILFSLTLPLNTNTSITTSLNPNKLTSLKSLCKTTPYPKLCFNSLKLSISININPNIITYLLHSLQLAISETTKLSNLFHDVGTSNIVEKQRGSIQDCKELHQSTLTSLKRSLSGIRSSNKRNIADARIYLSAALTNKNTCLDGLDSASGTYKPILVDSIINTYKHGIMMKIDSTVITGNRSVVDGWTTFRSATLAVSGDGFLARDIAIENRAGPEKHQAVALRVNADLTAFYKCAIYGYQDTLYVHSFRQFYRECDIYGTIDFIFGNAAVVLQECDIVSRMPLPGQFTVITAQSRDNPDEDTGISIQNCSIIATDELYSNSSKVKSYLGRPWRVFSRTVLIESYIDDFIDQKGWTKWSNDQGLDTLFYGEYENYGPGSKIDNRVEWVGYHLMDYNDAYNFSVSEFIIGDQWLESTSVPYDDGI